MAKLRGALAAGSPIPERELFYLVLFGSVKVELFVPWALSVEV